MKRFLILLLALATVCALSLTGCGSQSGAASSSAPASGREVNVCSWGEYIETDLIDQFEDETGIKVNYTTTESNETLYSLLKTGGSSYDVIVPSDYMLSRLIAEGMLEPLDFSNIPNFDQIGDDYKNLAYDPENLYSVPYTWGTTGIIYNTKMVKEPVDSWSILFDEDYKGEILMIDNPRDAMGWRCSTWATPLTPQIGKSSRRPMTCFGARSRFCRPMLWTRSLTNWRAERPPWGSTTPAIFWL